MAGPKKFSDIVGGAVDELALRDSYGGLSHIQLARRIKGCLIKMMGGVQFDTGHVTQNTNSLLLIMPSPQTQTGLTTMHDDPFAAIYQAMPKMLVGNNDIPISDKLVSQVVLDKILSLVSTGGEVDDDTISDTDPLTESITTDRVPDWSPLVEWLGRDGREETKLMNDPDQGLHLPRVVVRKKMFVDDSIPHTPNTHMVEQDRGRPVLYTLVRKDGSRIGRNTPFEFFHTIELIKTNDPKKSLYLLKIYTGLNSSTGRKSSVAIFLDATTMEPINSDYPMIDDPQSDQFFQLFNSGNDRLGYRIGYFNGGMFLIHNNKLSLIKDGKYCHPLFHDNIKGRKISCIKAYKNDKNSLYFIVQTDQGEIYVSYNFKKSSDSYDGLFPPKIT